MMLEEKKRSMSQVDSEQACVGADSSMECLRKELRITRFFCGIVAALLVCVLLGGALIFAKVQGYVKQTQPLVDKLTEVDYQVLNETMNSLNVTLSEMDWEAFSEQLGAVDWEALSEQLSELDMEALNEAIAGLDTEELSATLKNLNETAEAMKSFSDSLRAFFGKLGIGSTETDA